MGLKTIGLTLGLLGLFPFAAYSTWKFSHGVVHSENKTRANENEPMSDELFKERISVVKRRLPLTKKKCEEKKKTGFGV